MNQLSKTEEQLMEYIWKLEKVFMKDLIDCYSDPKPASTTIATLLKRMQDKGFVGYRLFGNSREYYPLVEKSVYFSVYVKGMIKNFCAKICFIRNKNTHNSWFFARWRFFNN